MKTFTVTWNHIPALLWFTFDIEKTTQDLKQEASQTDKRLDPCALQVKGSLQLSIDLPASDAVYHGPCYKNSYFGRKQPDADIAKLGQPENSDKFEKLTTMCDWFDRLCESLCSIFDMWQHMLKECGNDDNCLFKEYGIFIINAKWYADEKEDLAQ